MKWLWQAEEGGGGICDDAKGKGVDGMFRGGGGGC